MLGVLIPREQSNAMNRLITSTAIPARAVKIEALANMTASFESFCLASGIEALAEMMENDARTACGPRHARGKNRRAHRWGKTKGKIGFHGGKVAIERPRLRSFDGKEQALPSWEGATTEDWLGKWAMNQMLINISTRKFKRSVRLPEGEVPGPKGSGLSKSALDDETLADGTKTALDKLQARKRAAENRIELKRRLLAHTLQQIGLKTFRTPTATLTLAEASLKAIAVAPEDIPARRWKPQPPKLDQDGLTKAVRARDNALKEVEAMNPPGGPRREAAHRRLPAGPGRGVRRLSNLRPRPLRNRITGDATRLSIPPCAPLCGRTNTKTGRADESSSIGRAIYSSFMPTASS